MVNIVETIINGKWRLFLPEHRAARPEWLTGWEVERLDMLYLLINELSKDYPPIVFDVGTEEGDMSALMSKWGAFMVLFEPNEKVWPNVKLIWEANRLDTPLTFNGFCANFDSITNLGVVEGFPKCADGEVISGHGFRHLAENDPLVASIKIDTVVKTGIEPNIITMDVEGSEWEVLKGAENTLRTLFPVVLVSVHPEFMFHNHNQYENDMHYWMKQLGYSVIHLANNHEHHYLYQHPENTIIRQTIGYQVL